MEGAVYAGGPAWAHQHLRKYSPLCTETDDESSQYCIDSVPRTESLLCFSFCNQGPGLSLVLTHRVMEDDLHTLRMLERQSHVPVILVWASDPHRSLIPQCSHVDTSIVALWTHRSGNTCG